MTVAVDMDVVPDEEAEELYVELFRRGAVCMLEDCTEENIPYTFTHAKSKDEEWFKNPLIYVIAGLGLIVILLTGALFLSQRSKENSMVKI